MYEETRPQASKPHVSSVPPFTPEAQQKLFASRSRLFLSLILSLLLSFLRIPFRSCLPSLSFAHHHSLYLLLLIYLLLLSDCRIFSMQKASESSFFLHLHYTAQLTKHYTMVKYLYTLYTHMYMYKQMHIWVCWRYWSSSTSWELTYVFTHAS